MQMKLVADAAKRVVARLEAEATLPVLIERASQTLMNARTSAEVLEARDLASIAYDAAKTAGRIARAKQAHDEVLAAVHRAQADALLVEARAKMRLADEYDGAQERGEAQKRGRPSDWEKRSEDPTFFKAGDGKLAAERNAENLGIIPAKQDELRLAKQEIHEARKLRDAEKADPGKAERTLKDIVARGEEPTKAKLRREMTGNGHDGADTSGDEVSREEKALRKLTPEALLDEVLVARETARQWKAEAEKLKADRDRLKAELADLQADDSAAVIRRLQADLKNAQNAKWREGEKALAALRQVHALKKQLKALGAEEIPL